ncbi:uncharacterized protein LOC143286754 [Babylonia areolata]|uniref:uncharacterized protein LOC143286754 n=1 Tax=Babylonia areolata TaxID=304850 RepID=UPI003FD6BF4A
MRTESGARPVSSGTRGGRASGSTATTGSSHGRGEATASASSTSAASATRGQRVSSATRAGSSTYFDIANTILGSGGDLDDLLLSAAKEGDYNKVEQILVKRGDIIVDIDCKDKRTGNTALIWAAKKGYNKIVQLLLRHGADPTLRNYNARTAVEEATGATVTILLDSVSKAGESSHRLLLQAAWQGNLDVIRRLLSNNKVLDINCQNAEGLTPLMLVSRDVQLFERLARDLNSSYNPVEVATELMRARADVHARDNDGRSCLHYASQSMAGVADKLVDALLLGGSEPDQLDRRQFMPIHWASQHGNTSVVLALLDGGSEVNCRGFIGLTPLHISAHNDNQCTAVALLERGADVTLTDDRGFTPVDLAKTRKLKTLLKEAWTEATQNNAAPELAPVRTGVAGSREGGQGQGQGQGSRLLPSSSSSSGRDESPASRRRRGGEVIFDGMSPNPLGAQRGGQAGRAGTSRPGLVGTSERSRRVERQVIQDIENGRYTPSLLHGRESTRLLGTVRNKPGPPVLPNIARGMPLPAAVAGQHGATPDSQPAGRRSSEGEELRRSLEDGRNLLSQRSNAKRGALPMRGRLSKTTPVSTGERGEQEEDTSASQVRRTHRRTGSDPNYTRITDVAATIENIISNRRGRSVSTGEAGRPDLQQLAASQHMSPLRTPLERDTTCIYIPTTIPEANSPGSSTNTISFETDRFSAAAHHSTVPVQMMSLPPTSNRILPPTPTFLTQRSYSNLESALSRIAGKDDDSPASSKEPSPRSDDEIPDNKVRVGLANPMELLRSRSLLKEEFILAESRPSDIFTASSGSDPASSSSSLSTASSSPREGAAAGLGLGRAAYRRSDPSLLTLTLREKAMKGSGFRKSDPVVVVRRSEGKSAGEEEGGEKSSSSSSFSVNGSRDKPPLGQSSVRSAAVHATGGKVTRSQSLRLGQRSVQQPGSSSADVVSGNLKRSQSIGSVASESDPKHTTAAAKDCDPTVQTQDQGKGAPFSGKGRMVIIRDDFGEFDNVFAENNAKGAHPHPPSSSGTCSTSVQSSAKRSSEAKPESAYVKRSSERSSSGEDTASNTPRMSVSDVAISGVNQLGSCAAKHSSSPSSSTQTATPRQSSNTSVSKPPVPNSQYADSGNKPVGQKTVAASEPSRQVCAAGSKASANSNNAKASMSPSAGSHVQTGAVKGGGGRGGVSQAGDTRCSDTKSGSTRSSSSGAENRSVSAADSKVVNKDKAVTTSVNVSVKVGGGGGGLSPSSSAMPTNRTASASGSSSVTKPTVSKTGPALSSSTSSAAAAARSGGQSSAQKPPSSSGQPPRKSASTENLSASRTGSGAAVSGEAGRRQSAVSSSQRGLSSSARDVTARLSGSGASSLRASGTSSARSDAVSLSKSDTNLSGKISARSAAQSATQGVSKGGSPPLKTQTSQASSSKPAAAISAATPSAVAKMMQTVSRAAPSTPQSGGAMSSARSTGTSSVQSTAPGPSGKNGTGSVTASVGAQGSAHGKSTSSATKTANSPKPVAVSAKHSAVSTSGGQKSSADSKAAEKSVSASSPKSSQLTKSSSNSVLVENVDTENRAQSKEKLQTKNSSNAASAEEGIEPLVKITFSGMNPKPCGNISRYSDPASLVATGPVIVNPFENLAVPPTSRDKSPAGNGAAPETGFLVGSKPDKDTTGKKKPPTSAKGKPVKGGKKGRDSKRPLSSSSRQASASKRRGAKSKEPKAGDTDDTRPKSGKRVRSGKRRVKKAAEREADREASLLSQMASKGDMALISGIGWHMATSCADTSDVTAAAQMHMDSSDSDISDVESIEDAEALMTKLEVNRANISLTSPRFREIKDQGHQGGAIAAIPALTADGFPPMNLDVTQKGTLPLPCEGHYAVTPRGDGDSDHIIAGLGDVNDDVHKEILMRKLTPIPEMPSLTGPIGNVTEAIARFDRSMKDNQLNDLLEGGTPRNDGNRASSHLQRAETGQESAGGKGKSASRREGEGKTQTPHTATSGKAASDKPTSDINKAGKPPHWEGTKPSTSSSKDGRGKAPRRTQSLKEGDTAAARKDRPRRERKFSESKKDEEEEEKEIDNAIEEILSATNTSMSSTLRSTSTLRSGSNTLTEGDRHVLLQLKSHAKESPFHASRKSGDDDDDASTLCGDNSGGSGEGFTSETNPNLLKVMHVEQFDLGAKVKAMIDAGAEESKIKAMMDADQQVKHQEAKQIVKVMNSFRHMELHAGSSHNPREPLLRSESHRVSRVGASVDRVPLVRPSSAGAARTRGRFQEMKKSAAGGSAQQLADRNKGEGEEPAKTEEEGEGPGGTAVMEALVGDVGRDALGDPAASETMCSRLSRHSSRAGSACTENSLEEETIQWKKGNVLGKGAFGTVWCGLTNEGELIAVKQIELNTTDRQKAEREYEKVQEEVELLKTLNHINIVGYLGTSLEDSTVSIFMQFVPGGSIASILARFGALDETVFRRYTRQILQGVEYLHDNDVIHRDIKGGNVMLMPNGIIKLIDFGCAKRLCINLSLSQSQILRSMKGTPYWMAPEVVNESGHGKKSDIWSIGCTVFEMATRKPPWASMNPMAAIFAIGSGSDSTVPTLPDKFSTEAIAFVSKCLTRNQQQRPSATELLTDVFMMEQPSKR